MSEPPTSLLFDVFALSQRVGAFLDRAMAGAPLTPAEYALCSAVFELEAGTPSALAQRLGLPLTTAIDRLHDLETRSLARRTPSAADRRASIVTLSAEGMAAHRAANREFEVAHAAVDTELGAHAGAVRRALLTLRSAVERVTAELDEVSPRPTGGRAG